jgi:hypothetical protein
MMKKKKFFTWLIEFALVKPLSFLGIFLLLSSPFLLATIDVFITPLPGWFITFIILLAFVFMGFGEKYESNKPDPDRYENDK